MKKKSGGSRAANLPTVKPAGNEAQLELLLTPRTAVIHAFPLAAWQNVVPREAPRKSADASRRILEFASTLPDW